MSETKSPVIRTSRFENCRAVFQGGGCRGAAHAGAYQAAVECGVTFSAIAGTSAGSIVAALIGGGAQPDYLLRTLVGLNFTQLLSKPQPQDGYSSFPARLLARGIGWIPSQLAEAVSRIVRFGGIHSAEGLERWMNDHLSELLPTAGRPVRFRDLPLPTTVVATDLSRNAVKIWSSEFTPDESVAFAVRCSSSLPFFFQATVQGDSRFVDGGLLANLPAFVYKLDAAASKDSFSDPILAFCLEEEPSPPTQWTPLLLLKRIIGAVVDGGTDLHLRLDRDVHSITIPTLGVRATDFNRMKPELSQSLIDSGRRSTLEFFRNESTRWSATTSNTLVCHDEYQTFLAIVQEGLRPATEIMIACRDSVWTWKLFPTLMNWLRSGSKVRIALPPMASNGGERRKEEHRRQTLVSLGAQVVEIPAVEVCAFAFRRQDPRWTSAVMLDSEPSEYKPHSVRYEGYVHQGILDALILRLQALFPAEYGVPATAAFVLREADPSVLISLLKKGVHQYGKQTVSLTVEDLSLTEIDLIVHKLRAYKYRQIENLVRAYREHGLPLFTPAVLNYPNGEQSYVAPPVVELHGDRYVVIEGNTRTYFCYRANHATIRCLVVRGVTDALPGRPVNIARTLISSAYVPADKRMENFNYDRFRRIEGAIRQPQLTSS